MHLIRSGFLTTALLAAVAPAWAGTVATAALPINFPEDQRAVCAVVNSGTKVLNGIEIRIYKDTNTLADSVVTSINPGSVQSLLANADEIGMTPFVRCEVEGSGIGKKTPVSLCIVPSGPGDCLAGVTAP